MIDDMIGRIEPETILVGVDGSDGSQRAVRWAAARVRSGPPPSAGSAGSTAPAESAMPPRLRLVHVSSPLGLSPGIPPAPVMPPTMVTPPVADVEMQDRAARALLDSAAAQARAVAPGAVVTTDRVIGTVGAALVDASAAASLVVLGSRERGAVAGLVLGSVGVHVANHAACPTVVVHGDLDRHGPVVVGIDTGEGSAEAAALALAEARRLGVGVVAVHSVARPLPTGAAEAAAAAGLRGAEHVEAASARAARDLLAGAGRRFAAVPIELRVTDDTASHALLELASEAALVVVGSHGHGSLAGLIVGSTCQEVLRHASCPVAVVRPAGGAGSAAGGIGASGGDGRDQRTADGRGASG